MASCWLYASSASHYASKTTGRPLKRHSFVDIRAPLEVRSVENIVWNNFEQAQFAVRNGEGRDPAGNGGPEGFVFANMWF